METSEGALHEDDMEPFAHLPSWPDNRDEITRQIIRRPGRFKILLKIRDELHFLTEWLAHHADIVGYENIIIFDNKSSEWQTDSFYRSLPDDLVIARYYTLHNTIQNVDQYLELYEALSKSCHNFCFLDCDEYLVHVDDNLVVRRKNIPDALLEYSSKAIVPTVWLDNGISSRSIYRCDTSYYLGEMLRAGKPIIRSSSIPRGSILHNYDIDRDNYKLCYKAQFFVQHRLNLFPEKRIQSNIVKMAAEGLVSPELSIDEILSLDFSHIQDPGVHRYLNDINRLRGTCERATLTTGTMNMALGRPIEFFSQSEYNAFDDFRNSRPINFMEIHLGAGSMRLS